MKNVNERHIASSRSALMAKVKQKNTAPEMVVRSLLYRMGHRYRLHRKGLPGTPDIVFPGRKKAIFVHGCFWHRHRGCKKASMPKTRIKFWLEKFEANKRRDQRNLDQLIEMGWKALVVWECEISSSERLTEKLESFLRLE